MKNLLFGFLFMSLLSCEKSNSIQKYDAVGEALGTTYSIQFYAENEFDVEKALDSIFEDVNASMSTYRPNSDISKINQGDKMKLTILLLLILDTPHTLDRIPAN